MNTHITTDTCGFDRTSSLSIGVYACTCGWTDSNMPKHRFSKAPNTPRIDAPAQQSCAHGECFGGKCIYAKGANTIESLRRQVAELNVVCHDCKNTFKQPFVCITCGAQKLYDNTLQTAQKRAEKAEAENAALRKELVEAWETAIDWAQYASPYFQEKWGLAEDIKKLERARGHAKNDAK